MDVILALIMIFGGVAALIALYFFTWAASFVLLLWPQWVGDRVVLRFWPERTVDARALAHYRLTGFLGLALSVAITIPLIQQALGR